jgi:mono/diheme cytochrome c family protein
MWSSRRLQAAHASIFAFLVICLSPARAQVPKTPDPQAFFNTYCVTCHNQKLHTAGLALDNLDANHPSANAEVWERVIAKLQAGSMPPPGLPRPDAAAYHAVASSLEIE